MWATLRAYGREGYRAIVERDLDLAQRLARPWTRRPTWSAWPRCSSTSSASATGPRAPTDGPALDDLNRRIGEAALVDGRVFFGSTTYGGRVAFRPAFVNWRTREADVDLVPQVVRELGAKLA